MSNKKTALLHLVACIMLTVLGFFSIKAKVGMPFVYFVLAGLMGFLALVYFARNDDF